MSGFYFARRQPIKVLLRYVEIFLRKVSGSSDRFSRRIVQRFPRILLTEDQVGEQHPGDRAVRQAHAGIARRDEHIFFVHRIAADEREAIDGFHTLAAPCELDFLHHRESRLRPTLEAGVALLCVVRLAALVVLTADNQQVVSSMAIVGRASVEFARSGTP